MIDFSQQISDFIQNGTYNYQFDSAGNEILNPSSSVFQQVYFSLPLETYAYNNPKIESFYNVDFTEFIPSSILTNTSSISASFPQSAIDQINDITYQNTQLQSQLNSLVANNELNSGSADNQAVENIITNLRIQLGQGSVLSDFDSTFPYLPLSFISQNPPSSSI